MKFTLKRKKPTTLSGRSIVDSVPSEQTTCLSLGVGTFAAIRQEEAVLDFAPTPVINKSFHTDTASSISSLDALEIHDNDDKHHADSGSKSSLLRLGSNLSLKRCNASSFKRMSSSFLRVADLHLAPSDSGHPNFHYASQHPPPGVPHDPMEEWVALDNGAGSHAPIAPSAIEALAKFGLETALDQHMWTPDMKTEKLLKKNYLHDWESFVWPQLDAHGNLCPIRAPLPTAQDEVAVFSGNFKHKLYGHELPAVRAAGLVNMSPRDLVLLLLDSSRVHAFNPMSLGRTDLLTLQNDLDKDGPFGRSVTKIVQSESQPPILRKPVQFTSLIHAKQVSSSGSYLIVTRAVTQAAASTSTETSAYLGSEILMGVNLLLSIDGHAHKSFMINVNHIRPPLVPMFIAKKLGLSAAASFISDMRNVTDKYNK